MLHVRNHFLMPVSVYTFFPYSLMGLSKWSWLAFGTRLTTTPMTIIVNGPWVIRVSCCIWVMKPFHVPPAFSSHPFLLIFPSREFTNPAAAWCLCLHLAWGFLSARLSLLVLFLVVCGNSGPDSVKTLFSLSFMWCYVLVIDRYYRPIFAFLYCISIVYCISR